LIAFCYNEWAEHLLLIVQKIKSWQREHEAFQFQRDLPPSVDSIIGEIKLHPKRDNFH
jgi:hypothetical protein